MSIESNGWVNPQPKLICDVCHLAKDEPAERPPTDWNPDTGNHLSCEEFIGRGGR